MQIKRYIVALDGTTGEILETVCLDTSSEEEQSRLLDKVFTQGIEKLNYSA